MPGIDQQLHVRFFRRHRHDQHHHLRHSARPARRHAGSSVCGVLARDRKVLHKPVARQPGYFAERARFLKQVGGTGDDGKSLLSLEEPACGTIEGDDLSVLTTDD